MNQEHQLSQFYLNESDNSQQNQLTEDNEENGYEDNDCLQLSHNKVLSTKLKQNAKKLLQSLSISNDTQKTIQQNKNNVRFVPVLLPLKYLNNQYNFNKQEENQRKSFNLHLSNKDYDTVKEKLMKLLKKYCDPKIYNDQKIVLELIDQVIYNFDHIQSIPQMQAEKHVSKLKQDKKSMETAFKKKWVTQMPHHKEHIEKFKERQQRVLATKKLEQQQFQKDIEKQQEKYPFKPQMHKMSKEMNKEYKQSREEYQNKISEQNNQDSNKMVTAVHIKLNPERQKRAAEAHKRQFKKLQQQLNDRIQKIEKNYEAFQNLITAKNAYDLNEFVSHIHNKSVFFKYLLRLQNGRAIIDLINYQNIPQTIVSLLDADVTPLEQEKEGSQIEDKVTKEEHEINDNNVQKALNTNQKKKDELYTFSSPVNYLQERRATLTLNEEEPGQDDVYQLRKVNQLLTLFESVTDPYFKYIEKKKRETEEFEKALETKQQYQAQVFVDSDKTFLERIEIHINEKKRRMKNYEIQKKQLELRECTFNPEITEKGKKVTQPLDQSGNPVTVFDKLYTEAKTNKIMENQELKSQIEKEMDEIKALQDVQSPKSSIQIEQTQNNDFKLSNDQIKNLKHEDLTGGEVLNKFYDDLRISSKEIKAINENAKEEEKNENFDVFVF